MNMTHLIVGLGNPGAKYERTRHNIGFDIIDRLADQWGATMFSADSRADALTAEAMVSGKKVFFIKPTTYMNNSGRAVKRLADYLDVSTENILVVYDDVDLPLAQLRFAHSRGDGGHRGVRSVIQRLGKDFFRLRVGISPTDASGVVQKPSVGDKGINPFVMGRFSPDERKKITDQYEAIFQGVETWITDGEEAAMNIIN